ncbi:baseplate J/gp47 family protein [Bradyrhizobium sp. SZCCHNS3051]|uniref:baseplate J/gp47 family protein n=1 Tax=Bradyrhizobium sp. SZCCHNS3051 TaxID=3057320 RepID=UPI002916BDD4|nr:baseplate J/gp47 family protein [Bradyrhizobium sp. SZCCHNS3051]
MPLPSPQLDDRSFADLMREAEQVVRRRCPSWTDLTPGDPGLTLIEVFAYLTDIMLYRLNRIPEKVQVELLNLLGVAPLPPAAAIVSLTFSRSDNLDVELRLSAGTQVQDPSGAVTFATVEDAVFAARSATATARAIHAELVEGELVGLGTGEAGQSVRVRRPSMLRDTALEGDIVVAVEATRDELGSSPTAREFAGKPFIVWTETDSFLSHRAGERAFVVDRVSGVITFAPATRTSTVETEHPLAVPGKGREIRVWYRRGGGRQGNVAPGSLTRLGAPLPGLTVTNNGRAAGGEDGETVDEAIGRGRGTINRIQTAVTARDFERIADDVGGIARARAYAQRERWEFGEPGVVEVQIVPAIDNTASVSGAVTPAVLAAHQVAELMARVEAVLTERRPLGVRTIVLWTRCLPVAVTATVVVAQAESPDDVRARLIARLNRLLSPAGHWPFGRTLRASDVYETLLAEPGVRYCEQLRFAIDAGPERNVRHLARDPRRKRAVFASTEAGLFRSLDQARSWTLQREGLAEGRVILVRASSETPGLVAAIAESDQGNSWSVYVSWDGGERFVQRDRIQGERIYDAAWVLRDGRPVLLLATRAALRRLDATGDGGSTNIDRLTKDDSTKADQNGFYAVAAMRHPSGVSFVAVAARERSGVLISLEGSQARTFQLLPNSAGKDVRVLAFQREGDRVFLWAGLAAEAGADGDGLMRIEARAAGIDPAGWTPPPGGWKGGSCAAVDFADQIVVAASNRAGVLTLNLSQTPEQQRWHVPAIDCGLPINAERNALVAVTGVTVSQSFEAGLSILACGEKGIFASADGTSFTAVGRTSFGEQVPLPPNWLYCSGEHALTVTRELGSNGG